MIGPLCVITDPGAPLPVIEQAEAAARGGAGLIQLRDKHLNDADFAALARALIERLAPLGARLAINDRVEVACAIGAPVLHIGQSDGDPARVRARIGPGMVLGLSVEALDQLAAIPPGTVDYLGVGPVRATATKPDHAPPIGFDGLAAITAATTLPCLAIGGLGAADAPALRRAGAAGMAVVSAVTRAPDPQAATRTIVEHWREP